MRPVAALVLSLLSVGAAREAEAPAPPRIAATDLQRAQTRKPRDTYRGDGQAALSRVLNGHLLQAEARTLPCAEWTVEELQQFMGAIAKHRSSELQDVYRAAGDRRRLLLDTPEEHFDHWRGLNHIVSNHPHLREPQREAHCRQAVMWWAHHLAEEGRQLLRQSNITVPLLPEGPKRPCGRGEGEQERHACLSIEQPNSCDWCHSTQARHDAGEPGTSAPNALGPKFHGPDDGNPHGWDRKRRCDQDQMPRCGLCEGIGGHAWSDANDDIEMTPCEILAVPSEVNMSTIAKPLYPKAFTVKRKDGKQGGYSDTLIGWKTDPFCFGFFPQNDSIPTLCYRSQDAYAKYYDISRESARTDYNIKLTGIFSTFPNTSAIILQVNETMWIQNHLWFVDQCICTNPSGNHCTNPPCTSYVWHWDTFKDAQYLGRERVGVEWIQHHGTGKAAKMMELDHFILWSHHIWTDPVSQRPVRMWKPFNGLQNYDPEAWTDSVEDPSVFEAPPAKCKKGGAKIRINCDDEGRYHPKKSEGLEHLEALYAMAVRAQAEVVI